MAKDLRLGDKKIIDAKIIKLKWLKFLNLRIKHLWNIIAVASIIKEFKILIESNEINLLNKDINAQKTGEFLVPNSNSVFPKFEKV